MSIFLLFFFFFFCIEKTCKNISIYLKITLDFLNDLCYYIDKDRYRFDVSTLKAYNNR